MDALRKLFPISFKYTKDGASLAIGIILYVIMGIVAAALIKLATLLSGWIPLVGAIIAWALGVASALFGLYILAGIVIQVLVFCKIIKE